MNHLSSVVLSTLARFLFFVINFIALYLLVRGHNHPGGGFVAGVCSAIALVLLVMSLRLEEIKNIFRVDALRVGACGLLWIVLVASWPLVFGMPFLGHDLPLPTSLLFDIGIYFVVLAVIVKIFMGFRLESVGKMPLNPTEEEHFDRREP